MVDQVACGARIDAAAELGDLEKALELVEFMKKKRAMVKIWNAGEIHIQNVYIYIYIQMYYS